MAIEGLQGIFAIEIDRARQSEEGAQMVEHEKSYRLVCSMPLSDVLIPFYH